MLRQQQIGGKSNTEVAGKSVLKCRGRQKEKKKKKEKKKVTKKKRKKKRKRKKILLQKVINIRVLTDPQIYQTGYLNFNGKLTLRCEPESKNP